MAQVELAVLLEGMAMQYAKAFSECRRLEAILLDACCQKEGTSLQGLDVLMQELEQMSVLCHRLSMQSDVQSVQISDRAIEHLTLSHLRGVLRGRPIASYAPGADVELF